MKTQRVTKTRILQRIIEIYQQAHTGPFLTDEVIGFALVRGWYPVVKSDWHFVDGVLQPKRPPEIIPAGATSTTTPAGIARLDPSVRRSKRRTGNRAPANGITRQIGFWPPAGRRVVWSGVTIFSLFAPRRRWRS